MENYRLSSIKGNNGVAIDSGYGRAVLAPLNTDGQTDNMGVWKGGKDMTLKELQGIGFSRLETERKQLHQLEEKARWDMTESEREWNHLCIVGAKDRISGMIEMLYALGAFEHTERNEELWKK